jgi:hypothetical protein
MSSFNGPAESFVVAWVNGRLGRRTKEGSLSVREEGVVSTLYSYAVPIASIYDRQYVLISELGALERSSVTTSKHVRWVIQAIDHAPGYGPELFPHEQRATITKGRIPSSEYDWQPILVAFDARSEGRPPANFRGVTADGIAALLEQYGFRKVRMSPEEQDEGLQWWTRDWARSYVFVAVEPSVVRINWLTSSRPNRSLNNGPLLFTRPDQEKLRPGHRPSALEYLDDLAVKADEYEYDERSAR